MASKTVIEADSAELFSDNNQENRISSIQQPTVESASPSYESHSTNSQEKEEKGKIDTGVHHFNLRSFNRDGNYLNGKKWYDLRNEYVFKNREDGSKIRLRVKPLIHSKKIILDNSEKNYAAAIDIAKDNGWKSIKIKGFNNEAKAEIWFLANMAGLETKGYKPSKADLQRLAGAKEAEKQEGLEIRPSQDRGQDKIPEKILSPKSPEQSQDEKKNLVSSAGFEKTTQKSTKIDGKVQVSDSELIMASIKEIAIEAGRMMDLNDQQIATFENTINESVARAMANGKTVNMNTLADKTKSIKDGLPMIRQELDKSIKQEQRLASNRDQSQQQNTAQSQRKKEHERTR